MDGSAASGNLGLLEEFLGVGAGEVLVQDACERVLGGCLGEFAGAGEGGGGVGLLGPFGQVGAALGDVDGFEFLHSFP